MRPKGAAVGIVIAGQGQQRVIIATALAGNRPGARPHQSMSGQRPECAELRKADRNPTANGAGAVEARLLRKIEAFAPVRRPPRQHLGAEQADSGLAALRAVQAQRRLAVEINACDGSRHISVSEREEEDTGTT